MEWTDEAIVLDSRKHGETGTIVTLLTPTHGRHAGLVYGGTGSKSRGLYQPGNQIRATWRGRLAEHLGSFTAEMVTPHAALLLDDALKLEGLLAACAVAEGALPEREPHAAVFIGFQALLLAMDSPGWPAIYIKLELGLLRELGFGLDLESCVVTGETEGLAFVSPRTGRAVTTAAAAPYKEKLLRLPPFLLRGASLEDVPVADWLDGLALSAHFLERHVFWPHNKTLPASRTRFVDRLAGSATISGNPTA
ncbi:MAG: recO [Alphaproteobacteria bacterium]|jgi:DNA repair protein RecO (recombination protein O)|nr:recO [Alphaproteobacteria bacterium]